MKKFLPLLFLNFCIKDFSISARQDSMCRQNRCNTLGVNPDYAYDYTLTDLQNSNSGSHEIMLGYDLYFIDTNRIRSPRFF